MTFQDENFWSRMSGAVPGMFDLGTGIYNRNAAIKEAQGRLNASGMQQFDQASRQALAAAGNMDPQAFAQQRFNQAQGMLAGKDAADEAAMWRQLQSKGLLGLASHDPGAAGDFGVNTNKGPINPIAAAMYAARDARNADMSYKSLNEGQAQIDRQIDRAGTLGQQAANRQAMAQANRVPSRSTATKNTLSAASKFMKDTGLMKQIPGMLGSGLDWLKNSLSSFGGGGNDWFSSMDADSIDW